MDYGRWFNPGVRVLGAGLKAALDNDTVEEARGGRAARTTLVLEVIIVLMTLGAVTGTSRVSVGFRPDVPNAKGWRSCGSGKRKKKSINERD